MDDQLSFLSEEPPANPSRSQALEKDWQTHVATWPSTFLKFLISNAPAGWSGRTCPASYQAGQMLRQVVERGDGSLTISIPSPVDFGNSGMVSLGESLTLSILEFPSDAVASSLSDILETGVLPLRFYLSAKACRGILRRADKRGKDMPASLRQALEAVIHRKPRSLRSPTPLEVDRPTRPATEK